jgi:hypothetical protein
MSRATGIVDFEGDFLPYFRKAYNVYFPELKPDGTPSEWTNDFLEGQFNLVAYGNLISNTPGSVIPFGPTDSMKDGKRLFLYGLCVAHFCFLGKRGPGFMGAIASGSQGSVSMGTSGISWNTASAQWWGQSQWGAMFWEMTAPYRSILYVPPINPRFRWK